MININHHIQDISAPVQVAQNIHIFNALFKFFSTCREELYKLNTNASENRYDDIINPCFTRSLS